MNQGRMQKVKYRRLLFIDKEIREGMKTGNYPNCTTLANKYEGVGKRTIRRDINDDMKLMLDAPIEFDSIKNGYYYTEPTYSLPAFNLSESDLFAICIADKILAQYEGTSVYKKLEHVFEKITSALPLRVITDTLPSFSSEVSMSSFPVSPADGEAWQVVFDALNNRKTVTISYQKPSDDKPARRKLDPYHAVIHQGAWYILGFCHNNEEVRIFNLARMKDAELTGREFSVPEDFDPDNLLRKSFDIYMGGETQTVKIQFLQEVVPYIRERRYHQTQSIQEYEDGSIIFSAEINNLTGIIPWIFSWGPNAIILEPQELIEAFRNDLDGLVRNYTGRKTPSGSNFPVG